jgi:DNA-binding MurR/RpiR family transcriptional regulator
MPLQQAVHRAENQSDNPSDSVADRAAGRAGQLSPAESNVIDFLLSAPPEVVLWSAARLAAELGVSDATVVRTAQALGYAGLAELREALARRPAEPTLTDRLRTTLADAEGDEHFLGVCVDHQVDALDTMRRNVSADRFDEAVEHMVAGQRVVWCGIGPSAHLAEYAALLCRRIGHPSTAITRTGSEFADELLSVSEDDVVVVLAYGRVHRHVRVLLDRAAALATQVVLVTDVLGRTLGPRVDVVLPCGRGAPGLFASHGTTMVLIESLVLGLARRDPDAAQASLDQLNDLRADVEGRRIDVDPTHAR